MTYTPWYRAEPGRVHHAVIDVVAEIQRRQSTTFDRFIKLEALYDPNAIGAGGAYRSTSEALGVVTENVIASNVDTVTAVVATTEVRARFLTDDGDWSTQRTARLLEWYAGGLSTLLEIPAKCRAAFKAAAKKGTGLVKVYAGAFDDIAVEEVQIDDVIVDDQETRAGAPPRQIHQQRAGVDRDELRARFPAFATEIDRAQTGNLRNWRTWSYRALGENDLVVIESWRLPIGRRGHKGYVPGRHTIVIDGADLLDEPWHKDRFPFARIVWTERTGSWYGISGAERIAGQQRALNKRNWQIDRALDQGASRTTYVRPADANLAVKTVNTIGTIAVVKGDYPRTEIPPVVSGETYANRTEMKSSAFEEFGVSRLAAQSVKPAGIDSGVAMREYRDQTTQRFAPQEKAFEALYLDVVWLVLDACKDLGAAAPTVMRRTRYGAKRIPWAQVDMRDTRVQIAAASTISRTPAGRLQTVVEWAQAGIVSQDEARRLLRHPDLERAMSLYTAALEGIEHAIEAIEDGAIVMPEPFDHLELIVKRGMMAYQKDRDDGAPEEVLEGIRQYIVQAAYLLSRQGDGAAVPAPGPPVAEQPISALPREAMSPAFPGG